VRTGHLAGDGAVVSASSPRLAAANTAAAKLSVVSTHQSAASSDATQ
jgi:hypothetical protein